MRYTPIYLVTILIVSFSLGFLIEPSRGQATSRTSWAGEYFANPYLGGSPAITVADEVIDMNWFTAAPYESLPRDYFSVRWQTSVDFADGIYRFRVGADDGIRLFIDGKLIIDAYEDGIFRTTSRDVRLKSGEHDLTVEYFERTGLAGVLVDWEPAAQDVVEIIDLASYTTQNVVDRATLTARIASNNAALYAEPVSLAPIVATPNLYQNVFVLDEDSIEGWCQVQLRNGVRGWIPSSALYHEHLQDAPPSQDSDTAIIATALLPTNLYSAPERDRILTPIDREQSIAIVGRDASGRWLLVETDDFQGWVFAPAFRLDTDALKNLPVY